jgi:hypothetical protein
VNDSRLSGNVILEESFLALDKAFKWGAAPARKKIPTE